MDQPGSDAQRIAAFINLYHNMIEYATKPNQFQTGIFNPISGVVQRSCFRRLKTRTNLYMKEVFVGERFHTAPV